MHLLFDCFNTLINMSLAVTDDKLFYLAQIKRLPWQPLTLPAIWSKFKPHPDVNAGFDQLRKQGHSLIAMSNAPSHWMGEWANNNNVIFDHIIPLELYNVYKPHQRAYTSALAYLECEPSECIMVTANASFGDLEGAEHAGMRSILIDRKGGTAPTNILQLAEAL